MRKDDDRDRAIDRLLPQVLGGAASTPCVDGETLAAWTDGMLRASEAARVEQHVADCGRCQAMLGAFVRVSPVLPPKESLWQRLRLGWVLPLATAAAAVALWVVIPGQNRSGAPESTVTLADARRDTSAPEGTAPSPMTLPSSAAPAETAATQQSKPAAIGLSSLPPAVSVDAARQKAAAPADRGAFADAAPEQRRTIEEPSKPLGALAKDANRERDAREESARTVAEAVTVTPEASRVDTRANVGPPKPPPPAAVAASPAPLPPLPPAAAERAAPPAAAPAPVAGGAPARPAAQALERADAADARVAAARKSEVAAIVEIPSSIASTRWRIVGGRRLNVRDRWSTVGRCHASRRARSDGGSVAIAASVLGGRPRRSRISGSMANALRVWSSPRRPISSACAPLVRARRR